MYADTIKKVILAMLGIILFIAFCYVFFYVAIFLLAAFIVYYIYYRFFRKTKTTRTYNTPKDKKLNNVIMDAEYKEKK